MAVISVIIPCYNCAAFLPRSLGSLQAQSFTDWEAICVDDGSTDRTLEILDEFSRQDARIRVIHQANGGPAAARNRAVPAIQGQYCLFMDSDDFLHPQLMEICLHFAEEHGSDLVAYTYDRAYRTRLVLRHLLHRPDPEAVAFKHYRLEDIHCKQTDDIFAWVTEYTNREKYSKKGKWMVRHCQPWRCLYRSDIVRDLRFPEVYIYEDVPWWGEVLLRVETASILNLPLYFYYPNVRSIIHSFAQQKRVDSLHQIIQNSEAYYKANATPGQQMIWEKEFLSAFRRKLRDKERRLARQKSA